MTDEEKKKLLEGFGTKIGKKEPEKWTDEELKKAVEKQLRKLGVLNENEKL